MKVNELIKQLSEFPADLDIVIAGIFNADEIPAADDWSEYEDRREIESDDLDTSLEETKDGEQVVIQFYMAS